jgi:hypothetical protein
MVAGGVVLVRRAATHLSWRLLAVTVAFVLFGACDDFSSIDRVGVEAYNASQADVVVSFESALGSGRVVWLAVPSRSQVGGLIGERGKFGGRVSVFASSCTPQGEVEAVVADQTLHVVIDDAGRLVSAGEEAPDISGLTPRDALRDELYLFPGDERSCADS